MLLPYPRAGVYEVEESWRCLFCRYVDDCYAGLVTIRIGTIEVLPALVVTSELGTAAVGSCAKWTISSYPLRSLRGWISIA